MFNAIKPFFTHEYYLSSTYEAQTNQYTPNNFSQKTDYTNAKDYLQFWQKFVDFSNKNNPDDITETDIMNFIDVNLYFKFRSSSLQNYASRLAASYKVVHNRDFNSDFPNVKRYLKDTYGLYGPKEPWKGKVFYNKKKTVFKIGPSHEKVWELFCTFTGKTEDWKEDEILAFFDDQLKVKKPASVNGTKHYLAQKYEKVFFKPMSDDFPDYSNKVLEMVKNAPLPPQDVTEADIRTQSMDAPFKEFCDFTEKTEGFVESDVFKYFEDYVFQRMKHELYSTYKVKLAASYYEKTRKEFDIDFPTVDAYITKRIRYFKSDKIWQKFCDFTNKSDNFTEEEILNFLEYSFTPLTSHTYLGLVKKYKAVMSKMYQLISNRNIFEDYPKIEELISKKITELKGLAGTGEGTTIKEDIDTDDDDLVSIVDRSEIRKQEKYDMQCENEWERFTEFTKKTEGFTENDFKDYFNNYFKLV